MGGALQALGDLPVTAPSSCLANAQEAGLGLGAAISVSHTEQENINPATDDM